MIVANTLATIIANTFATFVGGTVFGDAGGTVFGEAAVIIVIRAIGGRLDVFVTEVRAEEVARYFELITMLVVAYLLR